VMIKDAQPAGNAIWAIAKFFLVESGDRRCSN